MKTLWNVVSFLAVVHLLALIMFGAWLWQTDRLDGDRIGELRSMLATTIPEARATSAQAQRDAQALRERQELEARMADPPLPSTARIDQLAEARQDSRRTDRHLENVRRQLLQQYELASQQLEQERRDLDTQQEGLQEGLAAAEAQRSDTQLTKAVKLLESLPPKLAKLRIVELVNGGRTDQAVVYLNTMNQRAAGKVMAEFKSDAENKLATELLERIRRLGLRQPEAGSVKDSSDASTVADAH